MEDPCLISIWRVILLWQYGTPYFTNVSQCDWLWIGSRWGFYHLSPPVHRQLQAAELLSLIVFFVLWIQKSWLFSQNSILFRDYKNLLISQGAGILPVIRNPCHGVRHLQRSTENISISLLTVPLFLWGEELKFQPNSSLCSPSSLWSELPSGRRTSQNQVGFRWWDLSLRHCSVPSTLTAVPHSSQLFSLYISPPRNTLATMLINIPMPSENDSSSQAWHVLCHALGSVWTKEWASI